MYIKQHIIFGGLFSLCCFLFFPISIFSASLIFLSTILIDADHYLYYIYKKKNLNLKNAYKWFIKLEKKFLSLPREQRENFYCGFCFLHGIEILIVLFLLIFVSKYFLFIFIGVAFHLLLDIVYETTCHNRIDKFLVVYDYLKFKKLGLIEKI